MLIEHKIDKVCSCKYCTMIDIMYGDPLANTWEKGFIPSVARQGWYKDYSLKQKAAIERLFNKQKRVYALNK